jgi:hypothetical protein
MDIESIITKALAWEHKNASGDYLLNGKKGKFIKLEKDKPINILPAIIDPDRDLCTFPMHIYVKLGETSHKSFICRKVVGEPCPLCKAGLKPGRRNFCNAIVMDEDNPAVPQIDDKGNIVLYLWEFGKNVKQLLDASAALDKGRYDQWVQTLTKTGEMLNTVYNLVRNNKDFKVDPKAISKSRETYASPWDYLVENVQESAYTDFVEAQREADTEAAAESQD